MKTYQPAAGCGSDTYSLQAAGADGLSRTLVPYGTYSLYVNGSGTAYGTVAVGETSATLTVGTVTSVLALPAVVPVERVMSTPTFRRLVNRYRSDRAQRRAPDRPGSTTPPDRGDDGLTLVELLVAFAALMVLMGIAGTALTTYLTAGTTVISSYSATDQLLPSSIVIQRLIRSEVEPAPTPTVATSCAAVNAPCPAFLTGSVGATSTHLLRQRRRHGRTGPHRHGRVGPPPSVPRADSRPRYSP